MNQQSHSYLAANQVDSVCDRFEAAWDNEQRPSIEDYLQHVPAECRESLLRELLLIECEMLSKAGLSVNPRTYIDRFPESTTVVLGAWKEFSTSRPHKKTLLDPDLTLLFGNNQPKPSAGVSLQVGETIGDYLIIEELGRGGMGVVYRAKQRSAGREVALKVISADRLQSRSISQQEELVHRFRTEAQATARLDHPNIVTVYEVGEVHGQHYFSMRYVRGRSLADILADGPLDCRVAARYMEAAARAVQSAHQHSILHRDLNPRNILIDQASDEPLVADFGLAKMLDSEQHETVAGAVFGSPPYMPPEQVSESSGVRESADVYSLGATLYHMITGRPPFLAASVTATMYQVLNELPLRPRELDSSIDRDLETICLKCLQKEPNQRYLSAAELADDLERYNNYEPIKARPLGPIGIFWRWCLRNQMMASVITIAVTLLTISSLFSADAYIKASHALDREAQEKRLADQRRDEAMNYLRLISNAVGEMVDHVARDPRLREQGLEELRRSQLEVASRVYDRLLQYHPDDPELIAAQAEAFQHRGQILKLLGQIDNSEVAFQSALKSFEILTKENPDNVEWARQLAKLHSELGMLYLRQERLDDARQEFTVSQSMRQSLATEHDDLPQLQRDVAVGLTEQGQLHEAELKLTKAIALYDQARADFERLSQAEPKEPIDTWYLAECWLHLGRVYSAVGQLPQAENAYRAGLAILEAMRPARAADPELLETIATGQNNLADVLIRSARPMQASEAFMAAAIVFEELVREHPSVGSYLHKLAICNNNLASLHQEEGDLAAAEEQQRLAIKSMESLVKQFPKGLDYKKDLALNYLNLGILLGDSNHADEAEAELAKAQLLFEKLRGEYPHVSQLKQELAKCLSSRGKLALAGNQLPEADALLKQAAQLQEQLTKEFPQVPEYHRALAETLDSLAVSSAYQDRQREAEQNLSAATAIYVELAARYPDSLEIARELARCHLRRGLLLADADQLPAAVEAMETAVQLLEKMSLDAPKNSSLAEELADACFQRGTLITDEQTVPSLEQAIAIWKALHAVTHSPLYLIQQSRALTVLAHNATQQQQWEQSLAWRTDAVAVAEELVKLRDDDVFAAQVLSMALARRAETLMHLQRHEEAAQDWQAAVDRAAPEDQPAVQVNWARALALAGQHAESSRSLEKLGNGANIGRPLSVEVARVATLCIQAAAQDKAIKEAARQPLQKKYAELALKWLQLAVQAPAMATPADLAAQSAMRKSIATDEDFAPLRPDPEWKKLFPESSNPQP